jgi:hypothetical protein
MKLRRVILAALMSATLSAAHAQAADASAPALRRLTQTQYTNIIADVFGPDIQIGGRFEPDTRHDGLLELGAARASIAASGLAQYVAIARTVAGQVMDPSRRASFVACTPKNATRADAACARQFLSETGLLLYRRPLDRAELDALVAGAGTTADTLKNFYAGLETALATMLQSPSFLFRWEVTTPGNGDVVELDAYAKASRLSFFLWNAAPDKRLLTAAERGELNTPRGLTKEVDRMLASTRLEAGVRAYFYDMLGLDHMQSLPKDTTLYPKYSFAIAADAEEQTLRTIVDVLLTQKGDYRDIFTTRKTFLTRQLGSIYGVPVAGASQGGTPDGWQPYEFPESSGRVGILGHVSFLASHSHPGRTSPTLRGKGLREFIMCQKVPDPPGNVDFKVVQDVENPVFKTVRQRLNAHATEPMCTGCHKITDPIGLAMENFDTVGTFRADENGAAIDTTGVVDGVKFDNAVGLAKAIHSSPATANCLVNRLSAYAFGRPIVSEGDRVFLRKAQQAFKDGGYRFVPLLRDVVLDEGFFVAPQSSAAPMKAAALEGVRP